MWQYLFRLKRVQRALQSCWAALCVLRRREAAAVGGPPPLPRALRLGLWQQRQRMAHLVDSLGMYLQVDVIDACFATLRASVAAASDFSAADVAQRRALDGLARQAFLGSPQLAALVEGVLGLCLRIACLVQVRALPLGFTAALCLCAVLRCTVWLLGCGHACSGVAAAVPTWQQGRCFSSVPLEQRPSNSPAPPT